CCTPPAPRRPPKPRPPAEYGSFVSSSPTYYPSLSSMSRSHWPKSCTHLKRACTLRSDGRRNRPKLGKAPSLGDSDLVHGPQRHAVGTTRPQREFGGSTAASGQRDCVLVGDVGTVRQDPHPAVHAAGGRGECGLLTQLHLGRARDVDLGRLGAARWLTETLRREDSREGPGTQQEDRKHGERNGAAWAAWAARAALFPGSNSRVGSGRQCRLDVCEPCLHIAVAVRRILGQAALQRRVQTTREVRPCGQPG